MIDGEGACLKALDKFLLENVGLLVRWAEGGKETD